MRAAQVDDQLVDHALGLSRVFVDERAQSRQRVEQHVGLELRAQQPQFRFGGQALGVGSGDRFLGKLVTRRGSVEDEHGQHQAECERHHVVAVMTHDAADRFVQDQERDQVTAEVPRRDGDRAGQKPTGQRLHSPQPSKAAQHRDARNEHHADTFDEDEQTRRRFECRCGPEEQRGRDRAQQERAGGQPRCAQPAGGNR
ncbi:hypothetical protein AO062_14830 [Variovorax boronicumulans]|nr:hypothetical protein AO062_14830 [Variovorax boronicumulans]